MTIDPIRAVGPTCLSINECEVNESCRPMRNLTYLSLVALVVLLVAAKTAVAQAGAGTKSKERDVNISSLDLEWRAIADPTFPGGAFKALRKWMMYGEPSPEPSFALLDLNGDGTNELIVASGDFPSGGREYVLLKRRGHAWGSIGEFQGGFALSLATSNTDYYTITSFYRSGDTFQNTYSFSKGRYRLTNQVVLPEVLSRSCWWDAFWFCLNAPAEKHNWARLRCPPQYNACCLTLPTPPGAATR